MKERPDEDSRRDLTLRGRVGESAESRAVSFDVAASPFAREHGRYPRRLAHRTQKLEQAHPTEPIEVVLHPNGSSLLLEESEVSPPSSRLCEWHAVIEEVCELLGDGLDVGVELCR